MISFELASKIGSVRAQLERLLGNPDFVRYAQSYGAGGALVTDAEGLAPALEAAFAAGGVQLVAVPVDYSENIRVLVEELGALTAGHG